MPTYEYKCKTCGTFDVTQSIKDAALTVCPTCSSPVQRLISSNVAIVFKGSGFYVTDNRTGQAVKQPDTSTKETKPAETAKKTEEKPSDKAS